jgi:hypothetical protein
VTLGRTPIQEEQREKKLKHGPSSSPENVTTIVEERDEEQPAATTAPIPFPQKPNWDWPALQELVDFTIDGGARQRIQQALERQGFDLRHFMAYLQRFPLGRCRNPVGVLIKKAAGLSSELKHLDPDEPDPLTASERRILRRIHKCYRCSDTGRTSGKFIRRSVGAPCPDCELGKQARDEDYQEVASQIGRFDPSKWEEQIALAAERGGDVQRLQSLLGVLR